MTKTSADWSHAFKVPWTGRIRPNRDLSFVVTNELTVRPVVTSFAITSLLMHYPLCAEDARPPWSGLEEAFLWPHGPYRIKLTFIFSKSAVRHSQGSVRAPHGLENRCSSDAQSVNVRRKDVDRRLILDLTTCTVEANSLRHPHGDVAIATVFGRKQTARRMDALCDQGFTSALGKLGYS